ncbi:hypothetical protein [Enterobacter sp.]|nr:hypothetical protein [Enterobacter sp.]
MIENKNCSIAVRLTERQLAVLDKMIADGIARTRSAAIQYLINKQQVMG